LGITNPESADEVCTVKNRINKNRLKRKNFKPAVVESPGKQQINNIGPDQLDGLMEKIVHYIEKKHSKINMQILFRTDIKGEIADALSRILINNLTDSNESVSDQNTQQSAE